MATNKKKKRKSRSTRLSKKAKSKKVKMGSNRKRTFIDDGGDPDNQKRGIILEYIAVYFKSFIYLLGIVAGCIMIWQGQSDDGLKIKLGSFEFDGSNVGLVIVLLFGYALYKNNPFVKLSSKKLS